MSARNRTLRPERRQSSFFAAAILRPVQEKMEGEAVKSGYLFKRGGGKKSSAWKKRYFVLSGQNLYYFKSDKDINKKPQGLISPLREFTVENGDDDYKKSIFEFRLVPKDSVRTYYIHCTNHSEKDNWLTVFNQACTGLNQNKMSVEIEEKLRRSSYDIPAQDLEWSNDEKDVLGKGASGIVRKGLWLKTTEVAIKSLNNLPEFIDQEETMQFFREIETLSPLRHPNIVPMFGYCKKDGYLCLVTEYVKRGNLSDVLRDLSQPLTLRLRLNLLSSICRGMVYLHTYQIIHRDLKPGNILIENLNDAKVKVCDFGLSTFTKVTSTGEKETQQTFGTPQYAAPELSLPNPTSKVDVFSFAVIMWEMFSRQRPWDKIERGSDVEARVARGERLPIPEDVPDHIRFLIQLCWDGKPEQRPTMEYIYKEIEVIRSKLPPDDDPLNDSTELGSLANSLNLNRSIDSMGHDNQATPSTYLSATDNRSPQERIIDVFRGESSVTWMEIAIELQNLFLLTEDQTDKIKPVVANVQGITSRERWDDFVRWFNPIIPSEDHYHNHSAVPSTEGYQIDTIVDIVGSNHFFGYLSATEAREILEKKPPGSFLFRFSSNPGAYALSVNYGQIGHWRITTDKRGIQPPTFKIDGRTYKSIEDIIYIHRSGGEPLQVKTNNQTSSCYLIFPVDREEILKPKVENHYDNLY